MSLTTEDVGRRVITFDGKRRQALIPGKARPFEVDGRLVDADGDLFAPEGAS